MSTSLYELSAASYLQIVGGAIKVLKLGAEHAQAKGIDADDLVSLRLCDDMLPLHFQVVSIVHHSLGSIRGLHAGEFRPPAASGYPDNMNYAQLQAFLSDGYEQLKGMTPEDINALAGKPVVFRMTGVEIPFSAENFVLSFSLPNLNFHATTAYDLLRRHGVVLSKSHYLGRMRVSRPDERRG